MTIGPAEFSRKMDEAYHAVQTTGDLATFYVDVFDLMADTLHSQGYADGLDIIEKVRDQYER